MRALFFSAFNASIASTVVLILGRPRLFASSTQASEYPFPLNIIFHGF